MCRVLWQAILGLAGLLALTSPVAAQPRPYIGFAYPAGARQGTTVRVKVGGQGLTGLDRVLVTGPGVSVRVVDCFRPLGPVEMAVLNEQLRFLKRKNAPAPDPATERLISRIEKRSVEYVGFAACAALRELTFLEITIAPDAPPGERELRVVTPRGGASNPLAFYVGQLPEHCRKAMITATRSILGKEELALRVRPADEIESRITLPCTVNGQVAYGEINRYRFEARKGQRLVITTLARQLVPYIADAVPGWFQPVLTLHDGKGKEVACNDDYRFKPDPVIFYEVPADGEYVLSINDAIFRGREDFVYRISLGELPFVTSIFPLGGRVGQAHAVKIKGWNPGTVTMKAPGKDAPAGVQMLTATSQGLVSNAVPYALDTLPECLDKEPNDDPNHAQRVQLPVIVNGRIDRRDDRDVFRVEGRAGETIVAEVSARRLDSPLDSVLQVTDATGKVLALNDDQQDLGSGLNTHHADSYLRVQLPADGTYYVHLADMARNGGEEYTYRLRISAPRPDFALRVVPSSSVLRGKGTNWVSVLAIRQDGFTGPIKLGLKDPPEGFSAFPGILAANQSLTRIGLKTTLTQTKQPLTLRIEGRATIDGQEIAREAVPAEDRMQAFLWRHLLPAREFKVAVFDPASEPTTRRVPPELTPDRVEKARAAAAAGGAAGRKFTKAQVAFRVRQLRFLYEDGLLTDEFFLDKLAECEAVE